MKKVKFPCIEKICEYHRVINYIDQSWKKASRMGPMCEEGVEQFLKLASERSRPNED